MPGTRQAVSGILMGSAAKSYSMMSDMASRTDGCHRGIGFYIFELWIVNGRGFSIAASVTTSNNGDHGVMLDCLSLAIELGSDKIVIGTW